MNDLLPIFDTLSNKIHLWRMMRYLCISCDILHGVDIEFHKPRNSTEYFTYNSDKYWSKLIYGLTYGYNKTSILDSVNKGTEINLKNHWYPILCDKNYLSKDPVYYEITYYLCINDNSTSNKEKEAHSLILEEDTVISNIIHYVLHIKTIKRSDCKYLLNYLCASWYIDDKMINTFYDYITLPPADSCTENENKSDIIYFIKKFLL
jgi:hypothetical protein